MAIGDIYRVSIVGTVGNVQIVNTFHIRQVSGLIGTIEGDVKSVWETSVETSYLQLKPTTYNINRLAVLKVSPGTPEGGEETLSGSGGKTGDILPFQDACVLSIRTGIPGRRYRGRMYIGPIVEGDQASGILTAGFLTSAAAFVTAMQGAFGSTDQFQWMVWSDTGGFANPVTNVLIRDLLGTQRRRRPGVGA